MTTHNASAVSYGDFLASKEMHDPETGVRADGVLNTALFDFQRRPCESGDSLSAGRAGSFCAWAS